MKKSVIMCILCVILFTACGQNKRVDTENINKIAIELIGQDGKDVNEISLSEEDSERISQLLSESKIYTDKGFVFAEGMYRIVLKYDDNTTTLYPYCGTGNKLRVGESGDEYTDISEEDMAEFLNIINAYAEVKGGIYEWREITD